MSANNNEEVTKVTEKVIKEKRSNVQTGYFIRSTEFGTLIALIALVVFTIVINPRFLSIYNLQTLGQQWAMYALLAIGEVFVIVIGGGAVDLSLGGIAAFSGVLVSMFIVNYHIQPLLAIILVLIISIGWGLWHGLAMTKLNVPPFITTLGTFAITTGLSEVLTKGWPVVGLPNSFTFMGTANYIYIPFSVIILIIIAIITIFFFHYTIYGIYLKAIGANVEAARNVGINVTWLRTFTFILSSFLGGLVGIIVAARLGEGQPAIGSMYALYGIAAAVMGGTALTGGVGSIYGALIGAGIIVAIWNALVMAGVSSLWTDVVLGIVIVGAVSFDVLRHKRKRF
ncbi:MAG: ABC transporter permease [Sulfolobaceae archaeon]